MKMTPCNDYFFVLDRVKPITEGVIESWLVGAEPKLRQHRFVCKSNIINRVRFTLKGMMYTGPHTHSPYSTSLARRIAHKWSAGRVSLGHTFEHISSIHLPRYRVWAERKWGYLFENILRHT